MTGVTSDTRSTIGLVVISADVKAALELRRRQLQRLAAHRAFSPGNNITTTKAKQSKLFVGRAVPCEGGPCQRCRWPRVLNKEVEKKFYLFLNVEFEQDENQTKC